MFVFFEYAAIVALIAMVAILLFAVSAALLMVEEGFAAALRVLRRTANTMNMPNDGSGLQSHVAHANANLLR